MSKFAPRHGAATGKKTRTYRIWNCMVARCHCKSATGYQAYGGRGIEVCPRWRDFANFLSDMGEAPPGLSIDRLNGNGNYEPENCRWATRQQQNENRSSVEWVEYNGERMTPAAWARRIGVSAGTMRCRLRNSRWTLRQAMGDDPPPPSLSVPPQLTPEIRAKMSAAAKARVARNGGRVRP